MLDTNFVRQHFPAFSEPSLQGWAFFENAGGSYACQQVIDRLTRYYTQHKVQPYAPYPAASGGGDMMDSSYDQLAGYLNVAADEVNFGPSTTQNTYVLAQAFRAGWSAGDEVIVTNQDHEANGGAWRRLADTGIVIKEWQVDPDSGMLDPDDLKVLLSDRTKLVAFPHCSNIVAHVNPVAELCTLAHEAGAKTVVDGVSYAGHGFPDVDALGTDVYLFSLYKTFGPHQGLMVVRQPLLDQLANQSHFFNDGEPRKRLVPAGPDHAQVGAAGGIADYFDAVYEHHFPTQPATAAERGRALHELFQTHETTLLQPLLDYLSDRNDVRLLGPRDASIRAPTVAVALNKDPQATAEALAGHKVMCWSGHFYAYRLIDALQVPVDTGALRLSFVHYTTQADVDQLISALDQTL